MTGGGCRASIVKVLMHDSTVYGRNKNGLIAYLGLGSGLAAAPSKEELQGIKVEKVGANPPACLCSGACLFDDPNPSLNNRCPAPKEKDASQATAEAPAAASFGPNLK
jgi:hypothetical protein